MLKGSEETSKTGSVADWSKALLSGTSHFDDVGANHITAMKIRIYSAKFFLRS